MGSSCPARTSQWNYLHSYCSSLCLFFVHWHLGHVPHLRQYLSAPVQTACDRIFVYAQCFCVGICHLQRHDLYVCTWMAHLFHLPYFHQPRPLAQKSFAHCQLLCTHI